MEEEGLLVFFMHPDVFMLNFFFFSVLPTAHIPFQ